MGVVVLACLFIGSFAITRTPRTSAARAKFSTSLTANNAPTGTTASPSTSSALPSAATDAIESVFEITDGDVEDIPPAVPEDWNTINPPSGGVAVPGPQQFVTGPAGNAVLRTFVNDEGSSDRIFTQGGSKDFNDINFTGPVPEWRNTIGSVPDKDEIDQAYAAKYVAANGDNILVFGGTRHATNGDANIGFWFFQNAIGVDGATGTFTGFHKNGDLFLLSAFTGGGGTVGIRVLEWVGSDPNTPGTLDSLANRRARCAALTGKGAADNFGLDPSGDTLCDITGELAPGEAFVNSATTTAGWPYTPKGKSCGTNCIPIGASFEGGINLTALNLETECFSTFMLETRSSQSVDAVLKDFALGSFNTCVDFECGKVASPTTVCAGSPTSYTYTFNNTGAVAVTIDLVDDNGTPGNTGDDITIATGDSVAAGATKQYVRNNIVLTATTTNIATFTVHSAFQADTTCTSSATVTVNPNPTASAGPNQRADCVTAASTEFTMAGTATNGTPTWTCDSGDCAKVSIAQPSNPLTKVTFTGTGSATLKLSVVSASCGTATSTMTITVSPAIGVTVNSVLGCDLSGATTVTLTATTSGGTGPIGILWSTGETTASVSKGPGTYTVTVTDANNCTAQATRKIGLCSD